MGEMSTTVNITLFRFIFTVNLLKSYRLTARHVR